MNRIHQRVLGPLVGLVLLATAACGTAEGGPIETPAADVPAATGHGGHGAHVHVEAAEPSGYSIHHLESEWRDQHGRARSLESLGGRVQLVSMVYTHCSYACPQILADMKRIEAEIAAEYPEGIGFVLVSIDPERDTPDRLRYFAEATRLDPARWTLLSGDDADILELAAVLGVKYRRESATDFAHSNVITVLTPTGEVAHQQLGLGEDLQATLAAVRQLLE